MIPQWLDIDTQNTAEGIGFFFTSGIKKSNWIKYNINQNKIFCSIYFGRPKLKKFRTLPLLFQKCFKVPRKLKILLKYGMLTRFHHPDPRYIEQNQISICRKKLYSYYILNEDQITRTMNCCRWYIQNF